MSTSFLKEDLKGTFEELETFVFMISKWASDLSFLKLQMLIFIL